MCLNRIERPDDGWGRLEDLCPDLEDISNGRKYIQRIRKDLESFELVECQRPRLYRVSIAAEQIHIDRQVCELTDIDPRLLNRLRALFPHFID
jgi:hypothetical protein